MEIFELRYFLAVARVENVSRASADANASPAALSKAITRLEEELGTNLFYRDGRSIRLTPEGLLLKRRATEILQMEENARLELKGAEVGAFTIHVASEEVLQSTLGVKLAATIARRFPNARTRFRIRSEADAIEQVLEGEAHLALISSEPPAGVASRVLARVEFRTWASKKHPLLKNHGPRQTIPVEKILEHAFVAPEANVLGRISKSTSTDGWRDDKFPRRIAYRASGLKLMENLVREGLALAYLPDHLLENEGLVPLKIGGCPYTCQQTIRVIARDPSSLGWLAALWDLI